MSVRLVPVMSNMKILTKPYRSSKHSGPTFTEDAPFEWASADVTEVRADGGHDCHITVTVKDYLSILCTIESDLGRRRLGIGKPTFDAGDDHCSRRKI